jgi:hypothetical protein
MRTIGDAWLSRSSRLGELNGDASSLGYRSQVIYWTATEYCRSDSALVENTLFTSQCEWSDPRNMRLQSLETGCSCKSMIKTWVLFTIYVLVRCKFRLQQRRGKLASSISLACRSVILIDSSTHSTRTISRTLHIAWRGGFVFRCREGADGRSAAA